MRVTEYTGNLLSVVIVRHYICIDIFHLVFIDKVIISEYV